MNRSSVGDNLPIHNFITYYVWMPADKAVNKNDTREVI